MVVKGFAVQARGLELILSTHINKPGVALCSHSRQTEKVKTGGPLGSWC